MGLSSLSQILPIEAAIENDDSEKFKELSDQELSLEALNIAFRKEATRIAQYLLDAGASINQYDSLCKLPLTPLIGSAINSNVGIGKKLLVANANMNHKDLVNQGGALHWAMFYGSIGFAVQMLESGADFKSEVLSGQYTEQTFAGVYGYTSLTDYIDELDNRNNPLFGSWLMKEIHYQYPDTTYVVALKYPGRLIVSSNRYSIMYNPYGTPRKSAKTLAKIEEDEMVYAFKTMAFNSGTYSIEEDVFMTTADMAKVAGFEGGKQYYRFEATATGIQMIMFDETYPDGQKPEWYQKLEILFILEKE